MNSHFYLFTFVLSLCSSRSMSCDTEFHGFGIHLGSIGHLNRTNNETIQTVLDVLYHNLKIRHFRISYETYFSPSPGVYDLTCRDRTCTWSWESILNVLSNKTRYPSPTLMASVWTPPFYMKDPMLNRLLRKNERLFYYYIKNVTFLIQQKYGLTVEHISLVNEPENFIADWDHVNMGPFQLCRMVAEFNDPVISLCPESSWFWISQIYLLFGRCYQHCKILASHSYKVNMDIGSENFGLATYDLFPYKNTYWKPIWMTEVSSTNHHAHRYEMQEALDLAANVINFLGTTCVERYYFWLSYSHWPSGEALIWGNGGNNSTLEFPKKYYVYNHFTNASHKSSQNGPIKITSCPGAPVSCIRFDSNTQVFMNRNNAVVQLAETTDCSCGLCCTTEDEDISCKFYPAELPARSVCTCIGGCNPSPGCLNPF